MQAGDGDRGEVEEHGEPVDVASPAHRRTMMNTAWAAT